MRSPTPLNDENGELAWALDRHRTFMPAFPSITFVDNHDVTRIASQRRDPRHAALALAALFTVPTTGSRAPGGGARK